MIKGEGFTHEREVRLIAKSPALVQATAQNRSPTLQQITSLVGTAGKGFNLLIDLKRLVAEIVVHPEAESGYAASIQAELATKGLDPDLVKNSELATQ